MYINQAAARVQPAKEFASRSIEHRAEKRLNALMVRPSWEEGYAVLEETLDRAKRILIEAGKKCAVTRPNLRQKSRGTIRAIRGRRRS